MFQQTRSFLRQIEQIPSINRALDRLYEKEFAQAGNVNWFMGVYPDYASAIKAAPPTKPLGYDHEAPASSEMYQFRMQAISPCDYPVAFWLTRMMAPGQTLLDFGGHTGVLFYAFQKYLQFPENFRWLVYDLPAVIEEGRRFAQANNAAPSLSFCDEYRNQANLDWMLFSGSLQYLEEPLSSVVLAMAAKPRYILINMLPVHPSESYFTLQNISTAFCPYRIYSAPELKKEIELIGGQIIDEWKNTDKGCEIPYHRDHSLNYYRGYLITLAPSH